MPRKLHMKAEEAAPMERPGAGAPDDSGIRKRPVEEASVMIDPNYQAEVAQVERYAKREKLMAEAAEIKRREKETHGEERLKEIETELGIARKQELSPDERSEKELKRLQRNYKLMERKQAEISQSLKEHGMGSIGDIEAGLSELSPELREETSGLAPGWRYKLGQLGRRLIGRGLSSEVKSLLREYHDLGQRMSANTHDQSELRQTPFDTEAPAATQRMGRDLQSVEADMEKIRMSAGINPEMFDRLVAGFEKTKEKDLARFVKAYQGLMREEMELRKDLAADVVPEASLRVEAVKARQYAMEEDEARNQRLAEKPVAHQQLESKVLMERRKVWEAAADIEDAIKNFEGIKDDEDVLDDAEMFEGKQNEFAKRVRALESGGSGKEYDEALQAAEDALARYAVAINRRFTRARKVSNLEIHRERFREESDIPDSKKIFFKEGVWVKGLDGEMVRGEAKFFEEGENKDFVTVTVPATKRKSGEYIPLKTGDSVMYWQVPIAEYYGWQEEAEAKAKKALGPNEPRPVSVIGTREGTSGSFGRGSAGRRTVELSRLKTEQTEKREAAPKRAELVNKEVGMYRSAEWRKDLIDRINADEEWRVFMHGVYEDVSTHAKRAETGSPDAALDYALALFRGHARRGADNGYIYTESDRKMAQEEVKRLDGLFGWGERYKLKDESPTVTETEATPEEREEITQAVIEERLTNKKKKPEVTLSVAEAQARFDEVSRELEAMGVTTFAQKTLDPKFLEANEALSHAKRAERSRKGRESVQRYKDESESAKFDKAAEELEKSLEEEREAEQGIPTLAELQALARSEDMTKAQPKHEDLIHMNVPVGHIKIEDTPEAQPEKKKRVRQKPFESPEEEAYLTKEFVRLARIASRNPETDKELTAILGKYHKTGEPLRKAFLTLTRSFMTAAEGGARKKRFGEDLDRVRELLEPADLAPVEEAAPTPLPAQKSANPKKRKA